MPSDGKRCEQPLLHLDALTLVRLTTLDLEEVLGTGMGPYPEVDSRTRLHLIAEVRTNLVTLIQRVWRRLTAFELSNALCDELATQNGNRPC